MEKRRNFSSFPHYFIYIFLTSGVKLHIHLLNVVVQFIVFLTLSTLICRSTDISKCFSESFGIRDNGSRLYIVSYISGSLESDVLRSYIEKHSPVHPGEEGRISFVNGTTPDGNPKKKVHKIIRNLFLKHVEQFPKV